MTAQPTTALLAELADGHLAIRQLLDRLDAKAEDRTVLAEELSQVLARHRCSCMETVLEHLARHQREDHEQQVRLLLSATRGAHQLADRLRLPARDAALLDNVLVALRGLIHEHERLELELARLVLERYQAEPLDAGASIPVPHGTRRPACRRSATTGGMVSASG